MPGRFAFAPAHPPVSLCVGRAFSKIFRLKIDELKAASSSLIGFEIFLFGAGGAPLTVKAKINMAKSEGMARRSASMKIRQLYYRA